MSNLENITRKHYLLRKRLEDSRLRYETLALAVGEAKTRIDLEPQVISVLEELQRREHERAVGAYEELLTLFLRDVLPGHREVVMDLRTERSLPALDVYLRKGEGMPLEDALSGTGGSVTNILSAGLRFIALVRSGNRPFLVLDEPDCWIKPELAPKFAAVVQSVAEQLGVQVLMISHHDEQMFDAILPHRLRLEKNDQALSARWAPTSVSPEWPEEQAGLRSIELINFQSHAHTVIPLSPGLTLINGDNDIGKSAIVSALRGVFNADSNDQHIRHGAKSARVILDFGPDKVLTWERFRKGTHKVVYEMREPGVPAQADPLRKSIGAREVPEWVSEFGIGLIDDLDVQLANQKEPVFLLGKSPRERARALAIGGENAHVQEMLSIGKGELGEAKLTVKSGERELENLHRAKQILEVVESRDEHVSNLENQARAMEAAQREDLAIEALLAKWWSARIATQALSAFKAPLPALPEAPESDEPMRRLVDSWRHSMAIVHGLAPLRTPFDVAAPTAPDDQSAAQDLARRWRKAGTVIEATRKMAEQPFTAQPPETPPAHALDLPVRWRQAKARVEAMAPLSSSSLPVLPEIAVLASSDLPQRWHTARARARALSTIQDHQLPVVPPDPSESIMETGKLLARWQGVSAARAQAEANLRDVESGIEELERQIAEQPEQACPTCGRPYDHDHSRRDVASA